MLYNILAILLLMSNSAIAKDQLTIAWTTAPRTIDPRYVIDANSHYLEALTHCSLVDFDKNGKLIGLLAKNWSWKTPTTLEVELEKNIKFSDGSNLTPADVIATYEFFIKPNTAKPSPRKGAFSKVTAVSAKGQVVTFNLNEADSAFPTNLVVGILPKDLASRDQIDKPENINGCGAYKITSLDNQNITLGKNKQHNFNRTPKFDQLAIKIVKDQSTLFAKLRAGEIDLVQNDISLEDLMTVKKSLPNLKVKTRPGLNTTYLGFNMRDPILKNKQVRQAIAHAINREAIIKYILKGFATPANNLLTPSDPYYSDSNKERLFDRKKAMQLLDEAGYKDPDGKGKKERFKISYKTTTNMTRIAIAKAIAADLKKVGIKVEVQPLEWGRFKADVEAGKVQMWSLSWVGFKDPDIFRYVFSTEHFPPNGGNRGWYSNKNLDKLMTLGASQTDLGKRKKIYQDIQEIVSEELPYVFLWHEERFAVFNKNLNDFDVFADGRYSSLLKPEKK